MKKTNLYITTVAAFSVFICIFTVVMFVAMVTRGIFFPREPEAEYESLPTFEITEIEKKMRTAVKRFIPDGDLLFIADDRAGGLPKYREIYDKDYNLLWKGDILQTPSKYTTLEGRGDILSSGSGYRQNIQALTPDMKRNIIIFNKIDGKIEYWRYNDGYFEGFVNKQVIGYLAANGFTENKSEILKFEDLACWF